MVLLLGLGPQAYSSFFWREVEYKRLAALHAGFNVDAIYQELGQPSIKKAVSGTGYTESIFLRKEHIVMTISDPSDSVVMYSVLSCDPDFQPTFETEARTFIRLQSVPMSETELDATQGTTERNDERIVTYVPGLTVSSPDVLVEQDPQLMSNAMRNRGYFVGISGACADLSGGGANIYQGSLLKAPSSVMDLRRRTAADFYAESYGVFGTVGELGALSVSDESGKSTGEIPVTPFHFDLPQKAADRNGTQVFG